MKYLVPFSGALVVFVLVFLTLDFVIMKAQGLTLIFQQ